MNYCSSSEIKASDNQDATQVVSRDIQTLEIGEEVIAICDEKGIVTLACVAILPHARCSHLSI